MTLAAPHRVVLAIAIVLALTGVGGAVRSTATSDDEPSSESADASPVELISAGSEPRILMRIRPAPGSEQTLTTHQEQTIRLTIDGRVVSTPIPTAELDFRDKVLSARDHRIESTTTYVAARALPDPKVDPKSISTMSQILGSLAGHPVRCTRTDSNTHVHCGEFHVDFPESVKAVGDPLMKSLQGQLAALAMPFPSLPVGVGAHWRFTPQATITGLRVNSVADVVVTRIAGRLVEATLNQTVTFVPGPTELNGIKANVERGTLTGSGTITWNLDRINPTSAITIEGTSVMTATDASGSTRLEQYQRQVLRVTEKAGSS